MWELSALLRIVRLTLFCEEDFKRAPARAAAREPAPAESLAGAADGGGGAVRMPPAGTGGGGGMPAAGGPGGGGGPGGAGGPAGGAANRAR